MGLLRQRPSRFVRPQGTVSWTARMLARYRRRTAFFARVARELLAGRRPGRPPAVFRPTIRIEPRLHLRVDLGAPALASSVAVRSRPPTVLRLAPAAQAAGAQAGGSPGPASTLLGEVGGSALRGRAGASRRRSAAGRHEAGSATRFERVPRVLRGVDAERPGESREHRLESRPGNAPGIDLEGRPSWQRSNESSLPSPALPEAEVERLTERVLSAIDRRVLAYRERTGRT
jgi:hypothetical protein